MNKSVCPECGKSFIGEHTLSWHRQAVHGAGRQALTGDAGVRWYDDVNAVWSQVGREIGAEFNFYTTATPMPAPASTTEA